MSDDTMTFGARYAALTSVEDRLALETAQQRREPFAGADTVLAKLIAGAFRGERVAKVVPAKRKRDPDTLQILTALDDTERQAVAEHFEVARQEGRGSWHVPEDEVLSLGLIHLAYWMGRNDRLPLTLADAERARPRFRGAPEAVAVWVLEPLFEELYLPLKTRGWFWLGKRTPEQQERSWAVIEPLYRALGIDPAPLDRFRPGTGWSQHSTDDVIALRRTLVESWSDVADQAPALYRTYRLGQLVERYYAKAKNGQALRKNVLTKAHGRTLTAYFGGDWLAFLAFLGEQVHPREEIVQALPETKLMVGSSARAAQVAAEHGLPPEEVQRMLAAFWQQSNHASPVEQRVEVLKRFWSEFDELHARQRSGMRALWGLVQEHSFVHPRVDARNETAGQEPEENGDVFVPRLFERLLSTELNADIERLWGTALMPRIPDRLVTEPAPHARVAEAFGPALRFWEGAALTAWFLCEGPYSRTDIDGLANYHQRELDALSELGCPVDGALFRDLREAEQRYGSPERGRGLVISISLFGDDEHESEPRVSFEQLRDIITRHRRAWAQRYLDTYLRSRWELELRATAEGYHRYSAQKSKAPTLKQFAKLAAREANLWFGGDLTGVYGALGLKAPAAPSRASRLVPDDPDGFATQLYERLRGEAYRLPPSWKEDEQERELHNNFTSLAGMCVTYLQLEEAFGERPELKAFGRQKFAYRSSALSEDVEDAWRLYGDVVHDVMHGDAIPRPAPPADDDRVTESVRPGRNVGGTGALPANTDPPAGGGAPRTGGLLGRALGRLRGGQR